MSASAPAWFQAVLGDLIDGQDLSPEAMSVLMTGLLGSELTDTDIAATLVALRIKGESAEELAVAAFIMRGHCKRLETGRTDFIDTCGTGGDGLRTFNISTATAFVVAGAGLTVVKHGNRAVSSASGSADVLSALGVGTTADAQRCLEAANMAFCLAPLYHPAAARVGAVRRRLGIRTIFNAIGPLCNPALAPYQLLGVGRPEWLDPMAHALVRLGVRRAVLVRARDGLDEISLTSRTDVRLIEGHSLTNLEWTADDFGLPNHALEDLHAKSVQDSAALVRNVLEGKSGSPRDVVLANAAAALWVARRADGLKEGVQLAREAIDSGRARAVLEALARVSQDVDRTGAGS